MYLYIRQFKSTLKVLNSLNSNTHYKITSMKTINSCQKCEFSTCKYKYCSDIETAINEQITCEQQASQEYLAIATHFGHPNIARRGCYNFFMSMYDEEIGHMQALIQYQLIRGGVVCLGPLKQPLNDEGMTMCQAFKKALTMEREVTQKLEDIVILSEQKKDYQCADFITSKYLHEQMESIHKMAKLVTVVERLKNDESALLQFDNHLEIITKDKVKMPDSI